MKNMMKTWPSDHAKWEQRTFAVHVVQDLDQAEDPAKDPAEDQADDPAEDQADDQADNPAEDQADDPAEDQADDPAGDHVQLVKELNLFPQMSKMPTAFQIQVKRNNEQR